MKNKSAIILLLASNAISGFAQGISMLAIPWYFSDVIKNESLFGISYAFFTFISIFWSLYSGSLIDRYPRKNIFLGICGIGGLIVGGVALKGYVEQSLSDYLVIAVFGTTLLVYNLHYPAIYAFLQELSERKNYGKISSMIEVQGQLVSILAGAIAAILLSGTEAGNLNLMGYTANIPFEIKKWTIYEIFMMDAATYFIAFFLILLIRYDALEKLEIHTGPIIERIKTGFNFLKERPLLFIFSNASYSIFVVGNNVIWAYAICGIYLTLMLIPLLRNYKSLIQLKTDL